MQEGSVQLRSWAAVSSGCEVGTGRFRILLEEGLGHFLLLISLSLGFQMTSSLSEGG